ncbi:hypothetical protein [Streptomyces sp. NPDC096012]|uniref:hypothetical protein n=1 Tax=Streptomyces sp. NPDC096012 TaxID=3155684 RepID=UPI00336A95F1
MPSAPPPEQKQELDKVTSDLSRKREEVPEQLVSGVDQLTSTLRAVQNPQTPPQVRDGTVRTAQTVSSALNVIGDPGTPEAVRDRLTGLVKQVTAALHAANRPETPPEERRAVTLVTERSASVLPVIGDPKTSPKLGRQLARSMDNVFFALNHGGETQGTAAGDVGAVAGALATIGDPHTPDKEKKELAQATYDASSSLRDRSESDERIARMKKKQEEAASAQGLPDVPLPEAAAVCTNAVFDAVPEDVLTGDLKTVIPAEWKSEGVNDYYKSEKTRNASLNVLVQLQNDEMSEAPLAIKRLVPRLADAVPANELFATLGRPGLHCLRAALQLDKEAGVRSGSWVRMAEEKE